MTMMMTMMLWEDHNNDVGDVDDNNRRQGEAKVLDLHILIQHCL